MVLHSGLARELFRLPAEEQPQEAPVKSEEPPPAPFVRRPRGAALLAAPAEPEASEEAGEPSWSSEKGQNQGSAENSFEEEENSEEAAPLPCSGWLFVGPRHRCFRGLLRELEQDAGRFAHVQFYLCV